MSCDNSGDDVKREAATLQVIHADLARRVAGHCLRAFGVPNADQLFHFLDTATGNLTCVEKPVDAI